MRDGRDGTYRATIRTPRLLLVPMSCEVVRAVLGRDWNAAGRLLGAAFPAEWRDDGWQWLEPQATKGEQDDRHLAWGTRLGMSTTIDDGTDAGSVLAEVGFHGPPDPDGWVEVGYRVVCGHRRRGLAEEATSALLAWAAVHGATGVKASVSPDNAPSLGLLNKLGFTDTGSYQHPTLGQLLTFRRTTRAAL